MVEIWPLSGSPLVSLVRLTGPSHHDTMKQEPNENENDDPLFFRASKACVLVYISSLSLSTLVVLLLLRRALHVDVKEFLVIFTMAETWTEKKYREVKRRDIKKTTFADSIPSRHHGRFADRIYDDEGSTGTQFMPKYWMRDHSSGNWLELESQAQKLKAFDWNYEQLFFFFYCRAHGSLLRLGSKNAHKHACALEKAI